MNSDELKRACEMAGLNVNRQGVAIHPTGPFWWEADDPALPAYVAELLVQKVRQRKDGSGAKKEIWRSYMQKLNSIQNEETPYTPDYLATAEQRIRAAMAVLGGGE